MAFHIVEPEANSKTVRPLAAAPRVLDESSRSGLGLRKLQKPEER